MSPTGRCGGQVRPGLARTRATPQPKSGRPPGSNASEKARTAPATSTPRPRVAVKEGGQLRAVSVRFLRIDMPRKRLLRPLRANEGVFTAHDVDCADPEPAIECRLIDPVHYVEADRAALDECPGARFEAQRRRKAARGNPQRHLHRQRRLSVDQASSSAGSALFS